MADPNDFGGLLQALAAALGPSQTAGAGTGTGGLGGGLLDTDPRGPRPDQLDMRRPDFWSPEMLRWLLGLPDDKQSAFLRQILNIPTVSESERIVPPPAPDYTIRRVNPQLLPWPGTTPPTWPWQL